MTPAPTPVSPRAIVPAARTENITYAVRDVVLLAQEAAARRQLRDAQELEVEPVTLTRTLSYARAIEVERVIQNGGILSPRGSVIVDERTNTLIISDVPKKVSPIDALIDTVYQLKQENSSLRHQHDQLLSERSQLIEKTELARSRVEAMITRLRSLELNS